MKHLPIPILTEKQIARFWNKVTTQDSDECWEWQAGLNPDGYGRVSLRCKSYGAHRVSYFLQHQKDPGELCVCHTCDNPKCVNPSHLWLGTFGDDMRDMTKKGRGVIPHVPGSKHGAAKLTEQQVLDIRAQYANGQDQYTLGRKYGVAHQTIHCLVTRKSWKHI